MAGQFLRQKRVVDNELWRPERAAIPMQAPRSSRLLLSKAHNNYNITIRQTPVSMSINIGVLPGYPVLPGYLHTVYFN